LSKLSKVEINIAEKSDFSTEKTNTQKDRLDQRNHIKAKKCNHKLFFLGMKTHCKNHTA